jgi:hypothetical protein
MWVATVQHQPLSPVPAITTARRNPKFPSYVPKPPGTFRFDIRFRVSKSKVWAAKKQLDELETREPGRLQSPYFNLFALWLI